MNVIWLIFNFSIAIQVAETVVGKQVNTDLIENCFFFIEIYGGLFRTWWKNKLFS